MEDQFKLELNDLERKYLERLFDLLIEDKIIFTLPDGEKYSFPGIVVSDGKQKETDANTKKIVEQLYNLRTVVSIVYNNTESDRKAFKNLVGYIDFFNDKSIINIPLTDSKVRTLIENLSDLNVEDLTKEWYEAFKENKIDLRYATLQLLEYYTRFRVSEVLERSNFVVDPERKEYSGSDFFMVGKNDHSKVVLFDIKFQESIRDIKNIVLRGIEKLSEYRLKFEHASKHLIIVVYINQQEHSFSRLAAQFQKILIERDQSFVNRVFFIPISIFKTEDLQSKLLDCFGSLQGLDITFDYPDSPLNHGWTSFESLRNLSSIFNHQRDESFGNVLRLKLPTSSNEHYIDYQLVANQKWRFSRVVFTIQPGDDFKIYVEIAIQNDKKRFWLQVLMGDGEPKQNSKSGTEYLVYAPFRTIGNWYIITVDVTYFFDKTFRTQGLLLQRIEGVRLRGDLTIAKISFE
jgi:hypothetical protein